MIVFTALILAAVISIDTLACGFAYGTSNTKVPLRNVLVINIICSVAVSAALFLGYLISNYISSEITMWLSVGILVLIGSYKLVQWFCSKGTVKVPRQINWPETIILAAVLSLDGLAVGIGVSIYGVSLAFCFLVTAFSFVTDPLFFIAGHKLGEKTTKKTRLDLSWLSGVVLIMLGLIKLL